MFVLIKYQQYTIQLIWPINTKSYATFSMVVSHSVKVTKILIMNSQLNFDKLVHRRTIPRSDQYSSWRSDDEDNGSSGQQTISSKY